MAHIVDHEVSAIVLEYFNEGGVFRTSPRYDLTPIVQMFQCDYAESNYIQNWVIRVVFKKDRELDGPIIEFYSADANDRQFVSAYYLDTLKGTDANRSGLSLYASVAAWSISWQDLHYILNWCEEALEIWGAA